MAETNFCSFLNIHKGLDIKTKIISRLKINKLYSSDEERFSDQGIPEQVSQLTSRRKDCGILWLVTAVFQTHSVGHSHFRQSLSLSFKRHWLSVISARNPWWVVVKPFRLWVVMVTTLAARVMISLSALGNSMVNWFNTWGFMVLSYMTVILVLRVTGVPSCQSLIVFWLSVQLFPLVSLCVREDRILCTLQTCTMWCYVCRQEVIYFTEATPDP